MNRPDEPSRVTLGYREPIYRQSKNEAWTILAFGLFLLSIFVFTLVLELLDRGTVATGFCSIISGLVRMEYLIIGLRRIRRG